MRRLLTAISLLTATMLAACSDSLSVTPQREDTLAGTYTLRTINATPLPYRVQMGNGVERRYTGGRLLLRDDGTYTFVLDYTDFQGADSSPGYSVDEGAYTRLNAFSFQLERGGGAPLTGFQADPLTVRVGGDAGSWVYQLRR